MQNPESNAPVRGSPLLRLIKRRSVNILTLRLGFARMGVCGGKMQLNGGYNWRYAFFYVVLWQNEINHIKTMLMKRVLRLLIGIGVRAVGWSRATD